MSGFLVVIILAAVVVTVLIKKGIVKVPSLDRAIGTAKADVAQEEAKVAADVRNAADKIDPKP